MHVCISKAGSGRGLEGGRWEGRELMAHRLQMGLGSVAAGCVGHCLLQGHGLLCCSAGVSQEAVHVTKSQKSSSLPRLGWPLCPSSRTAWGGWCSCPIR